MCLVDKQAKSGERSDGAGRWDVGQCNFILDAYGMDCFVADLQTAREYWRDGEQVISEILDYCAGIGFAELWIDTGISLKTAAQLRELLKFKQPRGIF